MSKINLQVNGKQIDTIPIINLLRQGENNADTILMQLPPSYGDIALKELIFMMHGDSKKGTRATQILDKEINDSGVLLRWTVSKDFTAVAGDLRLILKGYLPDGDPIIKWVGGIINVYCDPEGGTYPPPVSEIEQALKEMYAVVGRAEQSAESAKLSAKQADASEKNAQKHAENARVSAENARMSALKSEQTAKAIEGEAQKVADTAQAGITAIADAGAAQVAAVQTEGTKKVNEIKATESLLPAPSAQDAGKVPMVDAGGTGYELGEVAVDAYTKAESDKRYAPMAAAIQCTASGELITLTDSAEFGLQGLKVYGKSTQDGEPTPENPIPIVNVGEGGSINLTISDTAEQKQIFPIPTPDGLLGIPVKRGGNYTDSTGQQWICDSVERNANGGWEVVKRCKKFKLKPEDGIGSTHLYNTVTFDAGYWPFRVNEWKDQIIKSSMALSNLFLCNRSTWGSKSEIAYTVETTMDFNLSFTRLGVNQDTPVAETINKLKKWISNNDIYFIAQLVTPATTPITDPELIVKLNALHTYYGITNLFCTDNAGQRIQYLADTKLYIDSKLQSLVAQYHANQAATLSLMPLETQAEMIQNDTNNILFQEGI